MFLVADAIKENHLAVSPETRLIEIINLTEKLKEEKNTTSRIICYRKFAIIRYIHAFRSNLFNYFWKKLRTS